MREVAIDGAVLLSAPHMSFSDEFASVVSRGLNFEPFSTSRHIVKTSAQEETR